MTEAETAAEAARGAVVEVIDGGGADGGAGTSASVAVVDQTLEGRTVRELRPGGAGGAATLAMDLALPPGADLASGPTPWATQTLAALGLFHLLGVAESDDGVLRQRETYLIYFPDRTRNVADGPSAEVLENYILL